MTDDSTDEFLRLNLLDANKFVGLNQSSPDEYKRHLLDVARFLAAFYLNYPLLVANSGSVDHSYPSIFDWPKTEEVIAAYQYEIVDRQQIAPHIPQEYTTKLPVQILCQFGYIDEAVYYADHFNDVRSSILIRLIEEECLDSIERFSTMSFIEPVFYTISNISSTEEVLDCRQMFKSTINALVELDSVLETKLLSTFEAHLVARMESLFAELALIVEENVALPRPPPYILQQTDTIDSSKETIIFMQIHCLIEVYLMAISYTNRLEMELGVLLSELICISRGVCVTDDQYDVVLSQLLEYGSINDLPIIEEDALLSSVFARVLVVVLLIVHRDRFSLEERKNSPNIGGTAIPYKTLLPDDKSNLPPLGRWLNIAQEADMSELFLFFRIIQEKFGSPNDFPPLTDENVPYWRAACYGQDTKFPRENSGDHWLKLDPTYVTDEDAWRKMNYIATKWTAPQHIVRQDLLQMRLKLMPEDVARVLNSKMGSKSEERNFQVESPISSTTTQSSAENSSYDLPRSHGASKSTVIGGRRNKRVANSYPVKGVVKTVPPRASNSSNSESSGRSHPLASFHADITLDNEKFSIDSSRSPTRPEMEKLNFLLLTPTPRNESKKNDWFTYSWLKLYPLNSQRQSFDDRTLPIPLLTLPSRSNNAENPQRFASSTLAPGAIFSADLNSAPKSSNLAIGGSHSALNTNYSFPPNESLAIANMAALNLNASQDANLSPKSNFPLPMESKAKRNESLSSARQRRKTAHNAGTTIEGGVAGDVQLTFQHVQTMSENRLRSILTNF